MPKQVLLVRGGALSSNTGIGGAHHNLATSLAEGEISGWSTSEVCEYPLRRRMNPLSRLYKRWFSHPRKVDKKTRGEHGHVTFVAILDGIRSLVPHDHLFWVTRNGEVMPRFDETYNSLGVEVNVSIYEHEVFTICLLHESTDGNITGAVDEGFIFGGIEVELDTLLN